MAVERRLGRGDRLRETKRKTTKREAYENQRNLDVLRRRRRTHGKLRLGIDESFQ